jgi:hypothetical protein
MPDLHRSIHMATGHLCSLAWYIRKNEVGVINYGRWKREGRRISTSAVPSDTPAYIPMARKSAVAGSWQLYPPSTGISTPLMKLA